MREYAMHVCTFSPRCVVLFLPVFPPFPSCCVSCLPGASLGCKVVACAVNDNSPGVYRVSALSFRIGGFAFLLFLLLSPLPRGSVPLFMSHNLFSFLPFR